MDAGNLFVDGLLLVVVTIAGLMDVHRGRIPNVLTYSAAALGLAAAAVVPGSAGLLNHVIGFAVGFVPFFLLYLQGGLGGGDVKLMAAIGAIKGYPFVLNAMISSILLGGLVALLILIWTGRLREMLRFAGATAARLVNKNVEPVTLESQKALPFGAVLCLGCYLTLLAEWLGYASPARMFL